MSYSLFLGRILAVTEECNKLEVLTRKCTCALSILYNLFTVLAIRKTYYFDGLLMLICLHGFVCATAGLNSKSACSFCHPCRGCSRTFLTKNDIQSVMRSIQRSLEKVVEYCTVWQFHDAVMLLRDHILRIFLWQLFFNVILVYCRVQLRVQASCLVAHLLIDL